MEADVNGEGSTFRVSAARALFTTRTNRVVGYQYDVASDGQRLLINTLVEESAPITIVVNWTAQLKK